MADIKREIMDGQKLIKNISDQQNAFILAQPALKAEIVETNRKNLIKFEDKSRKETSKLSRLQEKLERLQTALKNNEIKTNTHNKLSAQQTFGISQKLRDNNENVVKLQAENNSLKISIERNNEQINTYFSKGSLQTDRLVSIIVPLYHTFF